MNYNGNNPPPMMGGANPMTYVGPPYSNYSVGNLRMWGPSNPRWFQAQPYCGGQNLNMTPAMVGGAALLPNNRSVIMDHGFAVGGFPANAEVVELNYSSRNNGPDINRPKPITGDPKPRWHCEICDLELTSAIHAQQHMSGRRHNLVAKKISKPTGAGYYDDDGKWVRTATKCKSIAEKLDGVPDDLCCKLCNVVVPSKSHMDLHMISAKHFRNLKKCGLTPTATVDEGVAALLDGVDLSLFRTPDGLYYCMMCDVVLNHAVDFKHHLDGKKHQRKMEPI